MDEYIEKENIDLKNFFPEEYFAHSHAPLINVKISPKIEILNEFNQTFIQIIKNTFIN